MTAKLREVKALLMQRRHWPLDAQGRWLASVVRGHLAYYAVPGNIHQVVAFRDQLVRLSYAAPERPVPEPHELVAEGHHLVDVAGHGVVGEMPSHHAREPPSLRVEGPMPSLHQ